MIIKLDDSLIDFCGLETNNQNNLDAFELISDVRIRGFHFVIASRKLFGLLGNSKFLSEKSQKLYQKLYQNYTTEIAISNAVDFTMNIVSTKQSNTENNKFIEISDLTNNCFLLRNRLLLENTVDSSIYDLIVKYYIKRKSLDRIPYDWDVSMGGGSTTHSEFKRITDENLTYTLCVLDSDKISPSSNLGSTASKFITNPIITDFGDFFILPVHEMENLYPTEMISAVSNGIPKFNNNRTIINSLSSVNDCNSFFYIDLKKGINRYMLYNFNEDCKTYWDEIFSKQGYNTRKCSCDSSTCNHYLIHPFGRNIANEIIDFSKKIGMKIENSLNSLYQNIWYEIGKLLFEKFCRPKFMVNF